MLTNHIDQSLQQAVKEALTIPVLANGNIQDMASIQECLAYTGLLDVIVCDSVL